MYFDNTLKICMWSGDMYEFDHRQRYTRKEVTDSDERIQMDECTEDLTGAYE